MRQVCSFIKKNWLDKATEPHIDRPLYEKASKQFIEGPGNGFCDMVVGVLSEHYPDEYAMLTYLAHGDTEEFAELAASDVNYTRHLLGYEIVRKSSNGFEFNIDAIQQYLLQKRKYKKLNLSNDEKLAEIGERRNRIEIKLRKLVSRVLLTLLGEEGAKQFLIGKMDPKKRAKLSPLKYKELFDPGKSEIYFNDLREWMRLHWENGFRNIFSEDVEKFNSRMILLNDIGRADAHAKNVSDEDMQVFRGSMSWLEMKVDDYFS